MSTPAHPVSSGIENDDRTPATLKNMYHLAKSSLLILLDRFVEERFHGKAPSPINYQKQHISFTSIDMDIFIKELQEYLTYELENQRTHVKPYIRSRKSTLHGVEMLLGF